MESSYGLIADVKMLNFFRHIGETGLVVLGLFALTSVFIPNFWCRFLCPYGALLGLTSWLSPTRIRRNTETCIGCAKCAKGVPVGVARGQVGADSQCGILGLTGFAKATGHWNSAIPTAVYEQLVPNADQAAHPMPER